MPQALSEGVSALGFFPNRTGLPVHNGRSASTVFVSRPARASLVLRPADLLTHVWWAWLRGSDEVRYQTPSLVSYPGIPSAGALRTTWAARFAVPECNVRAGTSTGPNRIRISVPVNPAQYGRCAYIRAATRRENMSTIIVD